MGGRQCLPQGERSIALHGARIRHVHGREGWQGVDTGSHCVRDHPTIGAGARPDPGPRTRHDASRMHPEPASVQPAPANRSLGGDFRKVLGASGASNLADGIFQIALPLIAARLSDSPLVVAGVAIVGRLPWLVFVLFAGALADRVDRRRTMLNVQIARAIVLGALAALAWTDQLSIPILYLVAFALGMGETLFDTAAQSLVPSIVPAADLSRANGRLYAVELVMNQFVGPPLGGVLVGISVPLAFAGSAGAYALAAVGLALIAGSFRAKREGPRTRIVQDIAEGLRFLWHHPLLRTLAIMVGVMNLASNAVWAVFVLYAVDPGPMGLTDAGFGLIITTLAVGSVIGSLVTARLESRFGPGRVVWASVLINGVWAGHPGHHLERARGGRFVRLHGGGRGGLERHHRLVPAAHHAGRPAGSGECELSAVRMGDPARRRAAGRHRGRAVRPPGGVRPRRGADAVARRGPAHRDRRGAPRRRRAGGDRRRGGSGSGLTSAD